MLSINYSEKLKTEGAKVRLVEEKTSYFTGQELVVGVGKKADLTPRKWIIVARQVIAMAKQNNLKEIAIDLKDFALDPETLAANFEMANYEFTHYKTIPDERTQLETISLSNADKEDQKAMEKGRIIGDEVNNCRTLANTPAGDMTPESLAKAAKTAAAGLPIKVSVLGRKDMHKLGMGGMLGVAKGSSEPPQFIIMEYKGSKDNPIVLVGKGITFDSGGLNLKPGDHINDMHLDMSGGAAVIHAVAASARLKLKRNVIGLIPAVENMPSGSSYRPGDVLKTMSGLTIEIGNTDAEGRVVMADALTYAKQYKPKLVIDVATLTGAAEVALGQRASAIFSKDEKLLERFRQWGEASGDYVWPLPLWDEYEEDIKGNFGDWSNTGKSKWGGAITGAIFLYQWAKDFPWVHIDMAPRMTAIEGEFLAKGAAGAPVRLLVKALENL